MTTKKTSKDKAEARAKAKAQEEVEAYVEQRLAEILSRVSTLDNMFLSVHASAALGAVGRKNKQQKMDELDWQLSSIGWNPAKVIEHVRDWLIYTELSDEPKRTAKNTIISSLRRITEGNYRLTIKERNTDTNSAEVTYRMVDTTAEAKAQAIAQILNQVKKYHDILDWPETIKAVEDAKQALEQGNERARELQAEREKAQARALKAEQGRIARLQAEMIRAQKNVAKLAGTGRGF